ncbi:MAG: tyrosine--tRNA ligase [bacterium]|nr:tyrosine--tRNA ligase [bacterium]
MTIDDVLQRGVAEVLPGREALAKLMAERKIKVYLGIDPTGSLLTLGHSVVLRKLQQFAELGHDVILLIGNGTVRIGDPTGRDSTRPVLTDEEIEGNFVNWQAQASKIIDFSKVKIMHNGDWLDKLTYADMVKLMAQTTVQQLMERDMFQDRLKNGLPIHGHEIIYPLLQGYDSVAMDVDLEIGGTDQTFNMMMGRHLQKAYNNREKWVLTTPIINGTDGRKMSKSFGNFVALTEPANDMYGKLMSISDDMIVEYFTVLTDLSLGEIEKIEQAISDDENPMIFKKQLAHRITTFYHSTAEADEAQDFFSRTVQNKEVPEEIPSIMIDGNSADIMKILSAAMPEESKSNLRRLIEQRAVELIPQNEKVTEFFQEVKLPQKIKVGKRSYFSIVTTK